MPLSQDGRSARLFTPLGNDRLCLVEVAARESLGRLFECEVLAVSEDRDIDFDSLIGQPCHVEIDRGAAGKRVFHGVLAEGDWLRIEYDLAHYRLTLRPWFWLLDKTSDCRIFHDQSVIDIVRKTFSRRGFSDFRIAATHDYPVLKYTVQYRETDFNFLSRLMEQHGLYYYFEHSKDSHVLVLCDGPASHVPVPELDDVVYVTARDADHSMRRPVMQSWRLKRSLRSGRSALQDFNHLTPNAQMLGDAAAAERYAHADLEIFDYPGAHRKQADGASYAKVRLEAEQAGDKRREGAGYVVAAFAGAPLTFKRHPRREENGKYLVVGTSLRFGPQYYWSQTDGEEAAYQGEYDLLPFETTFRTPLTTPKPRIAAIQTAIVVGEDGEEIDCDDHGRVYVRFHWDRHGDRSARVRVAQVWAGQGWGAQIIPRIGMEVAVAFLEGDPDQPLVVGCLADPVNHRPPYDLPGAKTRAVVKSRTHKGAGSNEVMFEDKSGEQQIYVHGEKDLKVEIENKINIDAKTKITITCGLSSITMDKSGKIEIEGRDITLKGVKIDVVALKISHKMG